MTQQRQLFGTDGIRGVAGEFPLTAQSTYLIGRALGHDLVHTSTKAKAVIGQDTRESSRWIADRVSEGLAAVGVDVHSAGVITTPGIAYLARSRGMVAGVVISASHNPWTDNGIKVFSGDGFKLSDSRELAIEEEIFALLKNPGSDDDDGVHLRRSRGQPDGSGCVAAAVACLLQLRTGRRRQASGRRGRASKVHTSACGDQVSRSG